MPPERVRTCNTEFVTWLVAETSAMSSTSPFSHAVSPSTAKADAINDNRFIVVTVLMVIWDYFHQKMHKVTIANAKRTPKITKNTPFGMQF